jgi:hypothetical protein
MKGPPPSLCPGFSFMSRRDYKKIIRYRKNVLDSGTLLL